MAVYYDGYAVPADKEKVQIVHELPEGVEGPVYKFIVEGPGGGRTDIPEVPIHPWELALFKGLPLGYKVTIHGLA